MYLDIFFSTKRELNVGYIQYFVENTSFYAGSVIVFINLMTMGWKILPLN